jgi:hypothetical protein
MKPSFRIVTLPSADSQFAEDAHAAVAALDGVEGVRPAVTELTRQLRRTYPQVKVREQDALASFGGGPVTLYFYREGDSGTHLESVALRSNAD